MLCTYFELHTPHEEIKFEDDFESLNVQNEFIKTLVSVFIKTLVFIISCFIMNIYSILIFPTLQAGLIQAARTFYSQLLRKGMFQAAQHQIIVYIFTLSAATDVEQTDKSDNRA